MSTSPGTLGGAQAQPTQVAPPQTYPVQNNDEQYAVDNTDGQYVAPTEDYTQYDPTAAEYQVPETVQAQEEPVDTQTGYEENASTEYAEEATDPNQDYVLVENQDPVCQVRVIYFLIFSDGVPNFGCSGRGQLRICAGRERR